MIYESYNKDTPNRVLEDRSQQFRWFTQKDGKRVLQVACPWSQGHFAGIEWRDIPEVKE